VAKWKCVEEATRGRFAWSAFDFHHRIERSSIFTSSLSLAGSSAPLDFIDWVNSRHMCLQIIFNILFVLPKQPFRLSSFIYYTIDLVTDASCNCYSTFDCIWPTDLLSTRCPRTLLARNWTQLLHNLIIGQGIRARAKDQGAGNKDPGYKDPCSSSHLSARQATFVELVPFRVATMLPQKFSH